MNQNEIVNIFIYLYWNMVKLIRLAVLQKCCQSYLEFAAAGSCLCVLIRVVIGRPISLFELFLMSLNANYTSFPSTVSLQPFLAIKSRLSK